MRTTVRLATGAAALGLVSIAGPAYAQTSTNCAAYPQRCAVSNVVQDTAGTAGTGATGASTGAATVSRNAGAPSTLPFTGGESALVALAGAGAIAAGAALMIGSRRRGADAA